MAAFFIYPVILALLGWSYFSPFYASVAFCILIAALDVYAFVVDRVRPQPDRSIWSEREAEIIREHHVYLRYPLASRGLSVVLNATRFSAFIWVPWLLWNGIYVPVIIIGVHFFVTSGLCVRLDPILYHGYAAYRGDIRSAKMSMELEAVQKKMESLAFEAASREW